MGCFASTWNEVKKPSGNWNEVGKPAAIWNEVGKPSGTWTEDILPYKALYLWSRFLPLYVSSEWRFAVVDDELQLQKLVDSVWTFVHGWGGSGIGTGNWRFRNSGNLLIVEKETETECSFCGDYSGGTGSVGILGADYLYICDPLIDGSWRFSVVGENMELQTKISGDWEINAIWSV